MLKHRAGAAARHVDVSEPMARAAYKLGDRRARRFRRDSTCNSRRLASLPFGVLLAARVPYRLVAPMVSLRSRVGMRVRGLRGDATPI
jgi:hypothetical protein